LSDERATSAARLASLDPAVPQIGSVWVRGLSPLYNNRRLFLGLADLLCDVA
jgi:hypothetical protein